MLVLITTLLHCLTLFVASYEVPESLLLREILYTFQGIDGKYIKYDLARDAFKIDPEVLITSPAKEHAEGKNRKLPL